MSLKLTSQVDFRLFLRCFYLQVVLPALYLEVPFQAEEMGTFLFLFGFVQALHHHLQLWTIVNEQKFGVNSVSGYVMYFQ